MGMQKSMYVIPDSTFILDGSLQEYPLLLRDLPSEEKPREKLHAQGPEALSVAELTALLLVTGTTKEDVREMTSRIIREYGGKSVFSFRDPKKLASELGIPLTKAAAIVAAGELGRRFYDRSSSVFTTIRNAQDVYDYLIEMRTLPKEQLRGIYLNVHNRVIANEVISMGTVSSNVAHPREVFRAAIEYNAVAVILAHNHPSGEVTPSDQDIAITQQIVQAGKILGIRVLDHVIITKDAFASVKADY
ncbi:MAG: repair protein RadC [Candidatus Parcubacteria bacterium]|jgi:DNA repair protein RadC